MPYPQGTLLQLRYTAGPPGPGVISPWSIRGPLAGVQAVPHSSTSWSSHPIKQPVYGAELGVFMWCQTLLKGH